MKLSIIVPAYNAEDTLAQCLTAICAAVGEAQDCEVIVVDDGSTDQTAHIAQRFPVRLLRSEHNEGRLRAREKGARAAQADLLLFVDARVLLPANALQVLEALDYEPIMGGTATLNVQDGTALDRFLYLVRKRIYAPYYPQSTAFPLITLTPQNFARVPKGMGALLIDKTRFLAALPEDRSHSVNDDTRMLAAIVKDKEIRVPRDLAIVYQHRQDPWAAYRHLYERGPLFADFHLRPRGRYYPFWVLCMLLALAVATGMVLAPKLALWMVAGVALAFLAISVWLAEKPGDVFRVLTVLPAVSTLFGLGILKGKLRQFWQTSTRGRRLALLLILTAALGYGLFSREAFAELRITRWELVPVLAGLHLAFLAVNGLSVKVSLEIFSMSLKPTEWFSIAVVTTLGSYVASGAGGMALRAAILKRKFALSYTQFASLLTASYLLNFMLAAVLGLGACAAYYAEVGFWRWGLLEFFVAVGGSALLITVFRPSFSFATKRVRELVSGIYEGWDILYRHPRVLGKVGLLLLANFLLQTVMVVVGFAMFAIPLPLLPALLMAVLLSFSILLSLTPANLGIQEGIGALLSHLVGYGFHQGLAVMVVLRAVSMLTTFAVGPFCSYFLLRTDPWAASSETS